MQTINTINTAVYRLLAVDGILTGLCTVIKGGKRPSDVSNPAVTVETKRLEPGEGEGIWMSDVTVTAYVDMLENRQPDHDLHESIVSRVRDLLEDAKALPLIAGENRGVVWTGPHDNEVSQESIWGLVFVSFE